MVSSSARRAYSLVVTAAVTAVLFFFCNSKMLSVSGAWLLTGTITSKSNSFLIRERQWEGQIRNHHIFPTCSAIKNTAHTMVSLMVLKAKVGGDDKEAKGGNNNNPDIDSIKAQLMEYLAKRKEIGADELAQKYVFP
jgi:hypothetical protein